MAARRVLRQPEQGVASPELLVGPPSPQVYLRLRPHQTPTNYTTYTIGTDGTDLITTTRGNRSEKHFEFTSIFDRSVDQSEVYERCVSPRIEAEEGLTIVLYGTSGSGKTYTLLGDDENFGIIPRALYNIFTNCRTRIQLNPTLKLVRGSITPLKENAVKNELEVRDNILELCPSLGTFATSLDCLSLIARTEHNHDEAVWFWISYIEIYNELVYDLLAKPSKRFQKLNIIYNSGNSFVDGLTSVFVTNSEDALRLLRLGHERAHCASTQVNDRSSRSHCLYTVEMIKCSSSGALTRSSFKFCDLAGSERVRSTGSTGQRMEEAKNINRSLMVLGRCLEAACSRSQVPSQFVVIPYRESKLTLLLNSALCGKDNFIMVATLMPVDRFYDENQNVLTFAAIAKNIVFPEPVAMQLSYLPGALDFPLTACSSDDYMRFKRKLEFWEDQKFAVKDNVKLMFEDVKARAKSRKEELMATHESVNDEINRRQEQLIIGLELLQEEISIVDRQLCPASDLNSCDTNDT